MQRIADAPQQMSGLPPGFEEVLPSDVVKQLKMIDENDALTGERKRQKTDEVFSSLPTEIIDKLPHPPFFEHLPKEMQKAINQIRRNRTMTWHERHEEIHSVIDTLPENIRPRFPPPPPPLKQRGRPGGTRAGHLPSGFDEVLPKEVMEKVNAVRENSALSNQQKHERVESILSSLPVKVLVKLPLPPFSHDLLEPIRQNITKIYRNKLERFRPHGQPSVPTLTR
ncbi:hypothetical protein COOONC_25172 [Cooperia oncophora]